LLEFREVLGSVPYEGASNSTCESGKKITPRRTGSATTQVVLADRKKAACYLLGPLVLTGRGIDTATAVVDPTTSTWIVNIHFTNDDFVEKVARPYVGKQIAIIFRDVVEAVPTVNSGIVDRDVTISADFDEATARALARALS
jgi:preprotein translocase subunit SecD